MNGHHSTSDVASGFFVSVWVAVVEGEVGPEVLDGAELLSSIEKVLSFGFMGGLEEEIVSDRPPELAILAPDLMDVDAVVCLDSSFGVVQLNSSHICEVCFG